MGKRKITENEILGYVKDKFLNTNLFKMARFYNCVDSYYETIPDKLLIYDDRDYNHSRPLTIKKDSIVHYLNILTPSDESFDILRAINSNEYALFWVPENEWTEPMLKAAINQKLEIFLNLPDKLKDDPNVQRLVLHAHPQLQLLRREYDTERKVNVTIPQKLDLPSFNHDLFLKWIKEGDTMLFEALPKERVTKELFFGYLGALIKKNESPKYFGSGLFSNVPEELFDDKVIKIGCVQANPRKVSELDEKYQSQKLWNWLVDHLSQNDYTQALTLLSSCPEEYLTEEIALKLCKSHFHGVRELPDKFKNDDFYRKLINVGGYRFAECVDLDTISREVFSEALSWFKDGYGFSLYYGSKFPKNYVTEDIAASLARISREFYSLVPKAMQTKELCDINLKNFKNISDYPKKYFDEKTVETIMENSYAMMKYIPEEYLTDEFYKKYIAERKISFGELPKERITKELICDYLSHNKSVDFTKIDPAICDKDLINFIYDNHPDFIYPQAAQTPQITEWILDYYLNHFDRETVLRRCFSLGALCESTIKTLLNTYSAFELSKNILNFHMTEEVMDVLYDSDPSSMIFFMDEYKDKYRKISEEPNISDENTVIDIEEKREEIVEKTEELAEKDLTETFVQLSLFDFIA